MLYWNKSFNVNFLPVAPGIRESDWNPVTLIKVQNCSLFKLSKEEIRPLILQDFLFDTHTLLSQHVYSAYSVHCINYTHG